MLEEGRLFYMDKSLAPALTKGLHILDLIAKEEMLSFGEIQKLTEYNVSSLNRYIKVLVECGYITKTKSNKYMVGMKSALLSNANSLWKGLIKRSKKVLRELTEVYKVTTLIIGYDDNAYTCLNKCAHKDNLTMMSVGYTEKDIWAKSPWGVPYIASQTRSKQIELLDNLEEDKRNEIKRLLVELKEEGYIIYRSKKQSEIVRIVVPLINDYGQVVGVFGMGTFESKFHKENLEAIVEAMIKGKDEIV